MTDWLKVERKVLGMAVKLYYLNQYDKEFVTTVVRITKEVLEGKK